MKFCKNCGKNITKSIQSSDSRFCYSCYEAHKNYIHGRRFLLYTFRSLSLDVKIEKSKLLIKETIDEFGKDQVYLSYSGGKDSTVLSHLAKQIYPDILHIFANTTCEYPETLEQVNWEQSQNSTNLLIVYPQDRNKKAWTFKRVVDYYAYPMFSKRVANAIRTYRHAKTPRTKQNSIDYINRNFKKYDKYKELNISDKCCEVLKKNPIKKKAKELNLKCAIIGTLADESRQRELDWINNGCNVFYKRKDNQSRPLSFWTEKDIWEYIEKNNVKISSLYSKGYSRNGYMYCGFEVQFEPKNNNRFLRLKEIHPVQYDYFVNNFGDFMDIKKWGCKKSP